MKCKYVPYLLVVQSIMVADVLKRNRRVQLGFLKGFYFFLFDYRKKRGQGFNFTDRLLQRIYVRARRRCLVLRAIMLSFQNNT